MNYAIVFCAGMITTVVLAIVIIPIAPLVLLGLDFIDLTGAPMTPAWLERLKGKFNGKRN